MAQDIALRERFDDLYTPEPNSGCWLWDAALTTKGYGVLRVNSKNEYAHRLSYELHNNVTLGKEHVLHRCDNPPCVNPDHLQIGTHADNMADMVKKERHARGEGNGRAKFTDAQILAIRSDKRLQRVIAADYGTSQGMVSLIKNNKLWRHI